MLAPAFATALWRFSFFLFECHIYSLALCRSGSHISGVMYFRRCNHGTIDVHCASASGECIGFDLGLDICLV